MKTLEWVSKSVLQAHIIHSDGNNMALCLCVVLCRVKNMRNRVFNNYTDWNYFKKSTCIIALLFNHYTIDPLIHALVYIPCDKRLVYIWCQVPFTAAFLSQIFRHSFSLLIWTQSLSHTHTNAHISRERVSTWASLSYETDRSSASCGLALVSSDGIVAWGSGGCGQA